MDILCANLICAFKRNSSDGIGLRMHCFSFQIGKILNAATHTNVNCFSLTSLSIPNWPNSFHISNYSCWMFKGIVVSIRKHISFSLSALTGAYHKHFQTIDILQFSAFKRQDCCHLYANHMVLLCEPSTSSDFGLAKSADFWRDKILFRQSRWGICHAPALKILGCYRPLWERVWTTNQRRRRLSHHRNGFHSIARGLVQTKRTQKDHVFPNCVSTLQNVRWTSGFRTWKHVSEHTWTWLVMHAQLWFVRVILASYGREFRDKTFKFIFWKLFFNNWAAFFLEHIKLCSPGAKFQTVTHLVPIRALSTRSSLKQRPFSCPLYSIYANIVFAAAQSLCLPAGNFGAAVRHFCHSSL